MGGHASAWTLLLIQLIVSVAADAPGALAHTCKPMVRRGGGDAHA